MTVCGCVELEVDCCVIDSTRPLSRPATVERAQANANTQLWPELKAHGSFGELSMHAAQDVAKNWSAAFFEAKRRQISGGCASLPLRNRRLVPVT